MKVDLVDEAVQGLKAPWQMMGMRSEALWKYFHYVEDVGAASILPKRYLFFVHNEYYLNLCYIVTKSLDG